MYTGRGCCPGRRYNCKGSCIFRWRPDDGTYRKWFRPGYKNNECNPGSSKGPCYCHEEAADFFYRSEESSIHLLPLPYMYRSLPETQSGTPDRSGNVHDGSIQSGFQKCESLYQFCILQLLWCLRDVCVSAEPGSENTACRYEGRTS